MNHLGSGHVLMNNRQPSRRDPTLTDRANPYDTTDTQYGTFAANRQQPAASEDFFRGNATSGNVLGLVGC